MCCCVVVCPTRAKVLSSCPLSSPRLRLRLRLRRLLRSKALGPRAAAAAAVIWPATPSRAATLPLRLTAGVRAPPLSLSKRIKSPPQTKHTGERGRTHRRSAPVHRSSTDRGGAFFSPTPEPIKAVRRAPTTTTTTTTTTSMLIPIRLAPPLSPTACPSSSTPAKGSGENGAQGQQQQQQQQPPEEWSLLELNGTVSASLTGGSNAAAGGAVGLDGLSLGQLSFAAPDKVRYGDTIRLGTAGPHECEQTRTPRGLDSSRFMRDPAASGSTPPHTSLPRLIHMPRTNGAPHARRHSPCW